MFLTCSSLFCSVQLLVQKLPSPKGQTNEIHEKPLGELVESMQLLTNQDLDSEFKIKTANEGIFKRCMDAFLMVCT